MSETHELELDRVAEPVARAVTGWVADRATQFLWSAHRFAFPVEPAELIAHVRAADGPDRLIRAALRPDGTAVAYVELAVDRANRSGRVERMVVDPGRRGHGYGLATLRLVLGAAADLDLHRVDLVVATGNTAAVACYLAAGFAVEGTLRDARYFDGTFRSMHLMGLVLPEAPRG